MSRRSPAPGPDRADAPHLLYVAWGYPPCRGSGVYRAWATANAFAAAGWRVTVITAPRETFLYTGGIDASLEATIDPRIEIVRVPFTDPRFTNDLREWSGWRAHNPELWAGVHGAFATRSFPEPKYGSWRWGIAAAARRIHKRSPVDLVLGTANPHVDFVPGHVLHKEHGVPYVMDYRDAWQLDVFTGERLTAPGSAVDRWERRLIADAHAVWFVNAPIRDWHAQVYPAQSHRLHVVANGYDNDIVVDPPAARPAGEGLVFGYVGTLTGAVPLDVVVEGWMLARERSRLLAESRIELWGHLDHLGTPSPSIVRAMASFEGNDISYHGSVEKGEIADLYRRFHALLLILGTGRYVTSGKVYEYLSTGLPVTSAHDPANAASDVLRGAPQWFPATALTAEDIADALLATAEAADRWDATAMAEARAFATRYRRDAQLADQIAALTAHVSRTGASRGAAS